MTTEIKESTEVTEQPVTLPTIIEFIREKFPNAPNDLMLNSLRAQVPNGRLKFFVSSDQKRAYLMRGISALELQTMEEEKLRSITDPVKFESSMKIDLASKCCVWTSATADGRLNDFAVKGSGAGLITTLYNIVNQLSDFTDPETLFSLSAEI